MAIKFSDIFNNGDFNINNEKLEEVFNKTKDVAESVGKKSVEHLEISRKRVECLDAKTKLAKAYEKFGRLQYEAYIGNEADTHEIEGIAIKISELKNKIDSLTQEIEVAKAEFNEAVANATKKTRDAFQKEFDKKNKPEETLDPTDFFELDDTEE